MRTGHPVQEQQPVEVVDLVLDRTGLERVGLDGDLGPFASTNLPWQVRARG